MRQPGKYVQDLPAWDLPRVEDLQDRLLEELSAKARRLLVNHEAFDEEVLAVFLARLREMAAATVNETIEYWLKGLADGNDGQFPEFCVEVPYLERGENTDSLTLAYCVDNEDGSRTELNRVTLERILLRAAEETRADDAHSCLKVVACELRLLAGRLDALTEHSSLSSRL